MLDIVRKLKQSAGEQVVEAARKVKDEAPTDDRAYLSTGSTLLNLALSDRTDGGFLPGKYYFIVGDSASGKTFFAMTCLAEAAGNPAFADHRFIFDNVEDGALMDVSRFFGSVVQEKLEAPRQYKGGEDRFSDSIEDFYYNLDDALNDGRPFIYVLDSMDSLTSKDEERKFDEHKKAARKETPGAKDPAGSFGDGKAKKNSSLLRRAHARLKKTNSILIVISQTRDNIDAGPWGEQKTRSGGRALRFYATCEIWTSIVGQIKKKVNDRDRVQGHYIQLQVKKNRINGKLQKVQTAIYPTYGIDDIGSCIDYLVFEKWWKKTNGEIKAKELGVSAKRSKLIRLCEEGKLADLWRALYACWQNVEEQSALARPPRYA